MDPSAIYERITPIFCDVMDEDVELRPDMTAADVETWDSLSNIRLVVAVEEEFDVRFDSAEIASLPNLGALVDLVASKLAG
jgi:acyl carrier protein